MKRQQKKKNKRKISQRTPLEKGKKKKSGTLELPPAKERILCNSKNPENPGNSWEKGGKTSPEQKLIKFFFKKKKKKGNKTKEVRPGKGKHKKRGGGMRN